MSMRGASGYLMVSPYPACSTVFIADPSVYTCVIVSWYALMVSAATACRTCSGSALVASFTTRCECSDGLYVVVVDRLRCYYCYFLSVTRKVLTRHEGGCAGHI